MTISQIKHNISEVRNTISQAALNAKRPVNEISLIAVSKRISIDKIEAAYKAGHRDFGENYVQEWRSKAAQLPKDIRWHIIGPLQRNKVKYLVGQNITLHTVCSLSLINELDKQIKNRCPDTKIKILIEINVGQESTKAGISASELDDLMDHIAQSDNIILAGLMSMPPYSVDPESSRVHHRELTRIFNQQRDRLHKLGLTEMCASFNELSMGTSNDFAVAISEGATMVRVGTSIFGLRQ